MAEIAALLGDAKKVGSLLLGGRGRLSSAAHRRKAIELITEAHAAGAGLVSACDEIGIGLSVSWSSPPDNYLFINASTKSSNSL